MSEPIHILSLGAGVQSSTLALMAAAGEVTPMPKAAIFADTQAEPASVYRWLDWLENQLPFPVHRVSKGNLTEESLRLRERVKSEGKPWAKSLIPAYIKSVRRFRVCANCGTPALPESICDECGSSQILEGEEETRGILGRSCTYDFKVKMIEREAKRIAGMKRGEKSLKVIQWIGISIDEAHRMKPSRESWVKFRWPLVDMGMKRHHCLDWMKAHGFPTPPRSACIYCPFHSDREWRRLRDEEPEEFSRAVKFERDLQAVKKLTGNMKGVPFLHNSLVPIDQVDFSTDIERGQGELFGNDCTGLCGV